MEQKPKLARKLRSYSTNRIRHLLANRFEESVEAPRPRRLRYALVASFFLRILAALFRDTHAAFLPLWWTINRFCPERWREVDKRPTKSSSTGKLISSSTQINYGKGLVLHKRELVRRSAAVHTLICSICEEPSGLQWPIPSARRAAVATARLDRFCTAKQRSSAPT